MLSIWKLRTSSSISGPSYTTNPNWPKISAISAIVSLIGWRLPRRTGRPGVVTSTASAARRVSSSEPRSDAPRSASAASMATRTVLAMAPTCGRSSGGRATDPAQHPGQPALLAQDVELQRLERRDVGGGLDRRQRLRAQRLEVAGQVGEVHRPPCLWSIEPGITNPRASATSRARRGVVRRCGDVRSGSGCPWRARRSGRRSRCRERRGRPGSCGRSRRRPS